MLADSRTAQSHHLAREMSRIEFYGDSHEPENPNRIHATFSATREPQKGVQKTIELNDGPEQSPEHCSFPPPRADVQAPMKPSDLHLARLQSPGHHQSLLRPCSQAAVKIVYEFCTSAGGEENGTVRPLHSESESWESA